MFRKGTICTNLLLICMIWYKYNALLNVHIAKKQNSLYFPLSLLYDKKSIEIQNID